MHQIRTGDVEMANSETKKKQVCLVMPCVRGNRRLNAFGLRCFLRPRIWP